MNPRWAPNEVIQRARTARLMQTSLWLDSKDVVALI